MSTGRRTKKTSLAAFTIVAKNYLCYARTLASSFLKYHHDAVFFVLIQDGIEKYFDPQNEIFTAVDIKELISQVPNFTEFSFKYDIIGFDTAIKPFFIEYLFKKYPINKLIYFDTDILVMATLKEVIKLLDKNNIVLLPHIISPLPDDGKISSDLSIMQSGCYNLGFIALKKSKETDKFIKWWQTKTYDGAVSRISDNLFRDQRPIDLVPSIFSGVSIFKGINYNVAYWNLHERNVFTFKNNRYFVNGQPIVFFHFSGYGFNTPDVISKHQNRYEFKDFSNILKELFLSYKQIVLSNGYNQTIKWPYKYGQYDDGKIISDQDRTRYWELHTDREKIGNPFRHSVEIEKPPKNNVYWSIKESWPAKLLLSTLIRLLGPNKYSQLSETLMTTLLPKYAFATPPKRQALFRTSRYAKTSKFGVNVIAKFSADSGVAESAKSFSDLARSAKIPCQTIDIDKLPNDVTLYHINLFIFNADTVQEIMNQVIGETVWKNSYNIAFFAWEMSKFPDTFRSAFANLNEIWVGSDFCQKSIQQKSPIPVVKIVWRPTGVKQSSKWSKNVFGIPINNYTFLYVYDSGHYPERKNALQLIKAYSVAKLQNKTSLIIKTMHFDRNYAYNQKLLKEISKNKNVTLITDTYSREETLGLIDSCDCYVSPHHSEGFGATIFEAMTCGKPVIATRYSGNLEYMTNDNSYMIDYTLVSLKKPIGPYPQGYSWAQPNTQDLINKLQYVFEHQVTAKKVGKIAQFDLEKRFNMQLLSAQVQKQLRMIKSTDLK